MISPYSLSNLVKDELVKEVNAAKSLKIGIKKAKEKLASVLKKQDAALVIINRLKEERDDAVNALTKINKKIVSSNEVRMDQEQILSSGNNGQAVPQELANKIQEFAMVSTSQRGGKHRLDYKEFENYKLSNKFKCEMKMGARRTEFHPLSNENLVSYVFGEKGEVSCYNSKTETLTDFPTLELQGDMSCFCVNRL